MNIALPTILIILYLIIPGLLYQIGVYTDDRSRVNLTNPFRVILINLIPGFLIHLVFYGAVSTLANIIPAFSVDLHVLGLFFSKTADAQDLLPEIFSTPGRIFFYACFLWAFSFFIGLGLRYFIRQRKLDYHSAWYRFFRYKPKWHYLLNEYPETEILENKSGKIVTLVFLDIVVEIGSEIWIYEGMLYEYDYEANGNDLKHIWLKKPRRTLFPTEQDEELDFSTEGLLDRTEDHRYYQIPGDKIMIPVSNISNLLVTYVSFFEEAEQKDFYDTEAQIRMGNI